MKIIYFENKREKLLFKSVIILSAKMYTNYKCSYAKNILET